MDLVADVHAEDVRDWGGPDLPLVTARVALKARLAAVLGQRHDLGSDRSLEKVKVWVCAPVAPPRTRTNAAPVSQGVVFELLLFQLPKGEILLSLMNDFSFSM